MSPSTPRAVTRPRLAMAICVRDEQRFLAAHLTYHQALGVERTYLYLDRCTDLTAQIAGSFLSVECIVIDPDVSRSIDYVSDLHCLCMEDALRRSRVEGFDWLLTIDADEFACGDSPNGDLPTMLAGIGADVEMVMLSTLECLPMEASDRMPFWRQRFFQGQRPLPRVIVDPRTGAHHRWNETLGHQQGKSIVRVSADVQAYDSHRWVPNQNRRGATRPEFVPLHSAVAGHHYHYLIVDQQQWLEKYRKLEEPSVWPDGTPVELPKQCWKDAAQHLSDAELSGYFQRHVAIDEATLQRLTAEGLAREDETVWRVLRSTGRVDGCTIRCPLPPQHRRKHSRLTRPPANQPGEGSTSQVLHYQPATMAPADLQGFHGVERHGNRLFRWAGTSVAIRLDLLPHDYRVSVDMSELREACDGRFRASLDGRPIDVDSQLEFPSEFPSNRVAFQIQRQHFQSTAKEHWMQLEFTPLDTRHWPGENRRLGAAIFAIEFERIDRAG